MAKWYGKIGFGHPVEERPGYVKDVIEERECYGDILKNTRRLQTTDKIVDDITVSNQISIVSDPYTNEHFHSIRYIEFMGVKWKVTEVEVTYPRLLLSIGGVYNGEGGPET